MPYLTVQPAQGKPNQVPFDRDVIRVGRSSRNDIHLASDPSLSRFHAEFTRDGTDHYARDVGSRNGTNLNGKPLTEPIKLKPGDRITLGETVIYFSSTGKGSEVEFTDAPVAQSQNTVVLHLADIISSHVTSPGPSRAQRSEGTPQVRAFAVLSRAANELLSHRPLDETLEGIMDMVFEALAPERGVIMLLDGEELRPHVLRNARSSSEKKQIQLSRTIADMVVKQKQSVMISDAQTDERFAAQESIQIQGIHAALCVPLWNNKNVIGLVYVDTLGIPGKFQKDDLRLLTLLANLAAVKIENVRLFENEQKIREMEQTMQAAAQIQRRLLPAGRPEVNGFDITGYNLPCHEVGGDYYDFLVLEGGRLGVAIGDVAGKGLPAALLMASLQASFRAHASANLQPEALVARLNEAVVQNSMSNKFISFFYGDLNTDTGHMRYTNAGHNPPILLRASGEVDRLEVGGMILGVLPDQVYQAAEVTLQPGDVLVLFSDGITESQNEEEEQYGEERLIEMLKTCLNEPAEEIRGRAEDAIGTFVAGAPQFDDITLTVVKRN
jgi:phosphoserine phosphatase RsbU/P